MVKEERADSFEQVWQYTCVNKLESGEFVSSEMMMTSSLWPWDWACNIEQRQSLRGNEES